MVAGDTEPSEKLLADEEEEEEVEEEEEKKSELSLDDDDDDAVSDYEDAAERSESERVERAQLVRGELIYMVRVALNDAAGGYMRKPLSELNKDAARFQKDGDDMSAVAAYAKLFSKVAKNRLTHPELHVCHCNRASAYLNLELYEEALWDAMRSMQLAEKVLERNKSAFDTYIRAHAKKGWALLGLGNFRAAQATFDKGLKLDPFNEDLKEGLEEAQQRILEDILNGNAMTRIALPKSEDHEAKQKITMQPYSTPLHKIRTEDMLPFQLLTPFQAENDYHIKDTYNYMTVQADMRMPKRHFSYLEDTYRHECYQQALGKAIGQISAEDKDCRVLNLGSGSGLYAMMCLKAGAHHVTCAERWLYLAMSSKELLLSNGFNDEEVKVVYKRPTDLAMLKDVPIVCNLLLCDILDDGLLTSGLIPAVRHALNNLMIDKPIVIPCSATVYVQVGELRTKHVCGFDMSVMNRHRWMPAFGRDAEHCDLLGDEEEASSTFIPLSSPLEVWQFDMLTPPEEGSQKSLDIHFSRSGVFNAVRFWYVLHLYDDVYISSGPETASDSENVCKSLRPAIQYLKGQIRVEDGDVMPLVAMHNTVRMSFDVEDAEYVSLARADASFPMDQFSFLNDVHRNEAYYGAIERVIAKMKKEGMEVHALDMGSGSGLLSMMAAGCGSDSVVAAEKHDGLCNTARHVIAQNGLSGKISVVNSNLEQLERGKDVRMKGANLVVADLFDCGFLGENFMPLLEKAKRTVLQSDYRVVPAAASVYCMGIEALTSDVQGFDFSLFNKHRWDKKYEKVDLDSFPMKQLTKRKKVFEFHFGGQGKEGRDGSRQKVLKLDVIEPGRLNAIVFWFDLHLDEEETISSAPFEWSGGEGSHHWGQAIQYLERDVDIGPPKKVTILCKREFNQFKFSLKQGVGSAVGKSPWKVEWGGGSSVENPHYQRVHYCQLLVSDFLMRLKSKRFPPIEKDMKMMLANCGNLFLDPEVISEVYREFADLEATFG